MRNTPGPGKERVATGCPDRMISGWGEGVCVIPFGYGTPESRSANSRLIRAAPEMLALVRWVEEQGHEEDCPTSTRYGACACMVKTARALLAHVDDAS